MRLVYVNAITSGNLNFNIKTPSGVTQTSFDDLFFTVEDSGEVCPANIVTTTVPWSGTDVSTSTDLTAAGPTQTVSVPAGDSGKPHATPVGGSDGTPKPTDGESGPDTYAPTSGNGNSNDSGNSPGANTQSGGNNGNGSGNSNSNPATRSPNAPSHATNSPVVPTASLLSSGVRVTTTVNSGESGIASSTFDVSQVTVASPSSTPVISTFGSSNGAGSNNLNGKRIVIVLNTVFTVIFAAFFV